MKAMGYLRVSGKGQVDGDGPARQTEAILAFCTANGLQEPMFFSEEAVSGTVDAMDRPTFAAMIEAIESGGELACIVVERMDRLARDLMVSELLLAECRKRGIPVYASDQPGLVDVSSNGGDPTRILLRQILGAVAQWEKTALVMKLRKARDRKRESEGRCEGPKPFGLEEDELAVLRTLQQYEAAGHSAQEIAARVNQRGLKSPTGKPWTRASVYQVLKRRKFRPEGSET